MTELLFAEIYLDGLASFSSNTHASLYAKAHCVGYITSVLVSRYFSLLVEDQNNKKFQLENDFLESVHQHAPSVSTSAQPLMGLFF